MWVFVASFWNVDFDHLREPSQAVAEELCDLSFHGVVTHTAVQVLSISHYYGHLNCI